MQDEWAEGHWSLVAKEEYIRTHRMRVPGGWLYRVVSGSGIALAFVPATAAAVERAATEAGDA